MPTAEIDGIPTRYQLRGDGPAVLLFSPGGFNAVAENWSGLGVYHGMHLLEQLSEFYTCISFDKREAGRSGGRLERLSWEAYVAQGLGLLDHLNLNVAHLMGGCVGCSIAAATAVTAPDRVASLVLYSPAGGARYRMTQHDRFMRHLAFAGEHGLTAVADLARESGATFNKDPRVGPWANVLQSDEAFVSDFVGQDLNRYRTMVLGTMRGLFDRDTVPGVEPEDLLRSDHPALVVAGDDASHAPSAARYLEECLPNAVFWDTPVAEQNAATAPPRILEFLADVDARA